MDMGGAIYYILIVLNSIALALLVGGLFYVNVVIIPTFTALSTGCYAEVHHFVERYSDPYMPILAFSTILLAIGELWFTQSTWQLVSRLIGIVCTAGVALISILIHLPLNRRIRTWQSDKQIEHLSEIRARWIMGHRVRTIVAFIGLIALLLPVVFSSSH